MRSTSNFFRRLQVFAAAAVFAQLGACATVDRFGDRATVYNRQMQATGTTQIVDNVLRAAFQRPLQFSQVSTVTGQATAQGMFGGSLPIAGIRGSGTRLYTLTPSLQASGGPSFTDSNQNNAEFYNGIISPISGDIASNYINNGSSRLPFLLLTVAAIDYDVGTVHHRLQADINDNGQFKMFASVLAAMERHRLFLRSVSSRSFVGPLLTDGQAGDRKLLSAIIGATAGDGTPSLQLYDFDKADDADAFKGLPQTTLRRLRRDNPGGMYRLTRSDTKSAPCFYPADTPSFGMVVDRSEGAPAIQFTVGLEADGTTPVKVAIPEKYNCLLKSTKIAPGSIDNLTLTFRSVRGIFEYLGRVARLQVPAAGETAPAWIGAPPEAATDAADGKVENRDGRIIPDCASAYGYPVGDAEGSCYRLIVLKVDPRGDAVLFDKRRVRLVGDGKYNMSNDTVRLLSDLLALYSSVKSLPAPSIVPFVTH